MVYVTASGREHPPRLLTGRRPLHRAPLRALNPCADAQPSVDQRPTHRDRREVARAVPPAGARRRRLAARLGGRQPYVGAAVTHGNLATAQRTACGYRRRNIAISLRARAICRSSARRIFCWSARRWSVMAPGHRPIRTNTPAQPFCAAYQQRLANIAHVGLGLINRRPRARPIHRPPIARVHAAP